MKRAPASCAPTRLAAVLVLAAATLFASAAAAQPTFSKSFAPSTIGPGSISTLTFTITDFGGLPITGLAFADVLPAGVTIADPAQAGTGCGGLVSAPSGGTAITLSGGSLGSFETCSVTVNVTSATPGTLMNVSGDLTSSAGNSGTAAADLIVATNRPGFSKSFAPNPIAVGSRGTLTFTIDNTANASSVTHLTFTDNLPPQMKIADPANAATDCKSAFVPATLTALPEGGVIELDAMGFSFDPVLAAGSTCTVTVDVVATAAGLLSNLSNNLSATVGGTDRSAGKAGATLTATVTTIALSKEFTGDPAPPGGTVNLKFTIQNLSRTDTATNLTFQDNLNATLSGLAATGGPTPNPPCGAGSSLAGTSVLMFSGGSLDPGESCTFSVPIQVPGGAATGNYPNTTTALTGDVSGPVVGNQAYDVLFVAPAPIFSKAFLDDPAAAGGSTTLQFTITNSSATFSASGIQFVDELTTFLPFPVSVSLPPVPDPPCGTGSALTLISLGAGRQGLSLTDGLLPAGGSCVFSVGINIPAGLPPNVYVNTAGPITADVGEEPVTGGTATAALTVVGAPRLVKEFTNDPVAPGGTVTLKFTLTHDAFAPADATGVTFTDDLATTLAGLTATGPPLSNLCGPGNGTLTGSAGNTLLTFSGAALTPGQVCSFSVTLQVAAGAVSGSHPNSTSNVTATVGGLAVVGGKAQDTLVVSALRFAKQFINDPVLPGATVTLRFTLDNTLGTVAATNIAFTDNLNAALSGLAAVGLPVAHCGGTLSGTSVLTFSGGSVAAGASCTFDVTVQVPAAAADGNHINRTSDLLADIPPTSGVVLPPAIDALTVGSDLLALTKSFTDDPVMPGGTVTLQFNLTNLSASQAAIDIAFTDDLAAALSGLVATGLPAPACGGTLIGTSVLDLTGASLAAGASCQFSVTLSVPAAVPPGTVVTNTTSQVTGTIGGLPVVGDPASDNLVIILLDFSKSFAGPTTAGATALLTFTIKNVNAGSAVSDIAFTDNLGAVLSGLVATGLPASNICGAGSQLTGATFISLTGGNLGPSATCTFGVTLQVPAGAAAGTYLNTTSQIFLAGLAASVPASDSLSIQPPPLFSKAFAPATIVNGGVSTLTFTIDNTASLLAATSLAFADTLPAGVTVASSPNASTTCGGGSVTAVAGSAVVALSGGTVAAGTTCTVRADVIGVGVGTHVNTSGALTSSSGNSGTASASLVVNAGPVPIFSKAFAPATIVTGGVSTLTFTINNSASLVSATGLTFTDTLPAGVTVASSPNASTTCGGGSVTAVAGSAVVALSGGTVAASATCIVRADVTSVVVGTHLNTSGDLTSSFGGSDSVSASSLGVSSLVSASPRGNSGPASATLVVTAGSVPTFAKSFAPAAIASGGVSTLTFVINNSSSLVPATNLAFADTLPAPMVVATPPNASTTCAGGTLTAAAGTNVISYTGGSVAASSTCSVRVDVTVSGSGVLVNTTAALTSSLGNSGTASATVAVNVLPIPTLGTLGLLLLSVLLALFALRRLRLGTRAERA